LDVGNRNERERRIRELKELVEAGLFEVDADRLTRAIVQHSRNKRRRRLDGEPTC
jgi:anti-sigma28 factor (negative regulator of flagellin synthesis)